MTSMPLRIDAAQYQNEAEAVQSLVNAAALSDQDRIDISKSATELVKGIRSAKRPGLMEEFLAEYGLSTKEGVALMCLAEALLRVPDAETRDDLIEDKIAPSDWGKHLGQSTSTLVNASTWALMLTGKVLDEAEVPGPVGHLRSAVKRLGEPVIRAAVTRAIKEMGRQFVLGEDIEAAMSRGKEMQRKGYTYSYDMLGEAALTDADAERYFREYQSAIRAIRRKSNAPDIRANPGISVKLSALHPRYERAQEHAVLSELVPRVTALAREAKDGGMGLNIDAEEAERLSLSLQVIDAVLQDPALAGWDGFGIVVQAYAPRAATVLDELYAMAQRHDRKLMVRLVKGAYWDTEIKRAQVEGMDAFPVFTRKAHTDVSYIANARKLFGMADRIYPQFATHNAHTVAAIQHLAPEGAAYEFQRLHGMGEALHDLVMAQDGENRCRIYAPVGIHRDLLAYLVRRLLENGANSSFVNQVVDEDVAPEVVATDPFDQISEEDSSIEKGTALFTPERVNSKGFDLSHSPTLAAVEAARAPFQAHRWHAAPLVVSPSTSDTHSDLKNPAMPSDTVGRVSWASTDDVAAARSAAQVWQASPAERSAVLNRAADLYEANFGELFALLAREAGKTLPDAVAELREAVDFLRYYAARNEGTEPAGTVVAISPWNFPLAIFTGQISAALACGNAVLAKPAEQTLLIASRAVALLHEAGVPCAALQLLPGDGEIGAALTASAPDVVAFTGSTEVAKIIRKTLAATANPGTPLVAETGGLNAMIVDSTALPEQAVTAIVESAFQSAGQRCSALRCLYVQEDIADGFLEMLKGAMDRLVLANPWDLLCDVGPVIDTDAKATIDAHVTRMNGQVLHQTAGLAKGTYCPPTLIKIDGIDVLEQEIFGPVLHVATFASDGLDKVIDAINATGYGLTFGLQTRIDDRVQYVTDRIGAGNIYVNRNQIGAIVGSQPFGGHGLSGTGPKAGGPDYLRRFTKPVPPTLAQSTRRTADTLDTTLPGPTGESNRLSLSPRAPILCLGPDAETAHKQAQAVTELGGVAHMAPQNDSPTRLALEGDWGGVLWWGDLEGARAIDLALADRAGPIVPLITSAPDIAHVMQEQHVCVDTAAAGGNAALLGAAH